MKDIQNYYMSTTDKRLERIEEKLDTLMAFRWQLIGGAVAASAFVATVVDLLLNALTK